MPILRILLTACFLAPFLGACSDLDANEPYFTGPPGFYTETGNYAKVARVAICYNRLATTPQDLATLVKSACTNPQLVRQDYGGACTLQQPVRATFVCDNVNADIAYRNPTPSGFKGQTFGFRNANIDSVIPGGEQ